MRLGTQFIASVVNLIGIILRLAIVAAADSYGMRRVGFDIALMQRFPILFLSSDRERRFNFYLLKGEADHYTRDIFSLCFQVSCL